MLNSDNLITKHHINIRNFAIETYGFLQSLFPLVLNKVFAERDCTYIWRSTNFLNRQRVNSVSYGTKSVSFLGPKNWDILPKEISHSETLHTFHIKNQKMGSTGMPLQTLWNIFIASRIYLNAENKKFYHINHINE